MKKEIECGQIVRSLQGRDVGELYVVVEIKDKIAIVCNGTTKTLENPKKKNKLHLKAIPVVYTDIAQKIQNKQKINDQMIYHSIHEYKKSNKGES